MATLLVGLLIPVTAAGAAGQRATTKAGHSRWYTAWSNPMHATGSEDVGGTTLRMIVHLSQGGAALRVLLDNRFGSRALIVGRATVGRRASGAAIVPKTLRTLTFAGAHGVKIAKGIVVRSDPVRLVTAPDSDLAVSVFVRRSVKPSVHTTAFHTNYLSDADGTSHAADAGGGAFSATTRSQLLVSSVDVRTSRLRGTIVALGSSVVEGHGTTGPGTIAQFLDFGPDANLRWTDDLARRMRAELPAGRQFAIANAGIGGTTAAESCNHGTAPQGSSAQRRIRSDVLSLSNVSHLIVYAGTNDLFPGPCTTAQLKAAYRKMIRHARAHGVAVIVSTITPRLIFSPAANAIRSAFNAWVRRGGNCSGRCDGIVDFDAAIRWSLYPNAIRPDYDSGDTIHPNPAGYQAMADSIDLRYFRARQP